MTLLGWMHRKLRQNNNDVFKEFTASGGGVCNSITGPAASPDPVNFLASANDYFPVDAFDTNHPSLSSASSDLFTFGGSGFLTIGTLGIAGLAASEDDEEDHDYCDVDVVDANNNDATTEEHDDTDGAVTPAFTYPPPPPEAAGVIEKVAVALEAIAEKDDDTTTEDDLMVVSAELEKVLGGRNSGAAADLVASARASFATGGVDCPLQGFLFGSPVSDAESWQGRRDSAGGGRRTSLGELFLRTRFVDEKVALVAVDEGEDGKADGEEGRARKGGGGGKVMNRKLKDDEKYAGGASASKSKFRKILQIFHRKVYPESTALARSLTKKGRKRGGTDDEPPASPKLRCRKEPRLPRFGCCANRSSSPDVDDDEHNCSKSGHWIRTDADYLVLEL